MEIIVAKKSPFKHQEELRKFLQGMTNRLCHGAAQYGQPAAWQLYLKRLKLEVKAYEKTGNMEHLMNIANYAWLESVAPQNPKFHFDNTRASVTRGRV